MIPINFKEQNCIFAKDQEAYIPLPAFKDEKGEVISCYRLSFWERIKILVIGKLWLRQLTFNKPLQPQAPSINYPFEKPSSTLKGWWPFVW